MDLRGSFYVISQNDDEIFWDEEYWLSDGEVYREERVCNLGGWTARPDHWLVRQAREVLRNAGEYWE